MDYKPVSGSLQQLERLLRKLGVEGEAAFYAVASAYLGQLNASQRDRLPDRLRRRADTAFGQVQGDREAVPALERLVGNDPRGQSLPVLYQHFIGRRFREGSGKFFTPQPVAAAMASLLPRDPGAVVMDPTCGGGTFLLEAVRRWGPTALTVIGNDVETTLVDLTVLSLSMNAAEAHGYRVFDSNIYEEPPSDLGSWLGNVDFILANPPFSLPIEHLDSPTRLYAIGYRNSDALFLDRARSFLRPGGRLVCLLPHSIIANAEFDRLRHAIEEDWELLGVIGMPEGVFWTTARSSTRADILILEKSHRSDTKQPVVFAFAPSVGVPLNGRRQELDQGPNYLAEVVRDRRVRQALQLGDAR